MIFPYSLGISPCPLSLLFLLQWTDDWVCPPPNKKLNLPPGNSSPLLEFNKLSNRDIVHFFLSFILFHKLFTPAQNCLVLLVIHYICVTLRLQSLVHVKYFHFIENQSSNIILFSYYYYLLNKTKARELLCFFLLFASLSYLSFQIVLLSQRLVFQSSEITEYFLFSSSSCFVFLLIHFQLVWPSSSRLFVFLSFFIIFISPSTLFLCPSMSRSTVWSSSPLLCYTYTPYLSTLNSAFFSLTPFNSQFSFFILLF